MNRSFRNWALVATASLALFFATSGQAAEDKATTQQKANQLFEDGNYLDALEQYELLLHRKGVEPSDLNLSYQRALSCLQHLNRVHEIDEFREELADTHGDNWYMLRAIAQSYLQQVHWGYQIAGEFRRGNHRDGGRVMNALDRDRVRALQIYWQALALLEERTTEQASRRAAELLRSFAGALMYGNDYGQAWRLQIHTDIENLPDYQEGWGYQGGRPQGAPVDAQGNPVFYDKPVSWELATNDGQRWRWLLTKLIDWQPQRRNEVRLTRAHFLQAQFGVQTLVEYGWWFGRQTNEKDSSGATGTFALHTLGENETIARLSTGIKRLDLPDEYNHVWLFQRVLEETSVNELNSHWRSANSSLAQLHENRRQYPRAAKHWQQAIERNDNLQHSKNRLEQIVSNWGRFEPVSTQPAGQGATVDFRFRNGNRVDFVARRINIRMLLTDVKAYLSKDPRKLDWEQSQLENLGHRLVMQGQEKYVGAEAARWSLDLNPLEDHYDRRITVSTPLQKPGAYLLTSQMADGNETNVILWLNDTAIVKKPMSGKSLYYVADAVSGRPVAGCNVEFFGFWQEHLDGNKYRVHTKTFSESTDEQGLVEISADEDKRKFQWVAIATDEANRFAFLGFRGVWAGNYYDEQYRQVKVFSITDRPVYRPAQQVQFKFWVRHAQYDLPEESRFAAQSFQVEIRDPKNERVYSTQVIADAYGGLTGSWEIPSGATLGQYHIQAVNHGGTTFRVEEHKKPEFEVTVDAPDEPVKLGDKITATIAAKYYFGSPVTKAKVKYKILRTPHQQSWFPPGPWDWLYGSGYGWFAENYSWYPGWARWGCMAPYPWWFWRAPTPPEIVAEREVELGPDGKIELKIDTAPAKQFHPDQNHRYEIQAEVVDQSRRTIVGSGQVLVAKQPFRVYVWTNRGYYRVGDTIHVSASARTLDRQPVAGTGLFRLLKIQYEDAKPVETEVGRWEVSTGDTGRAEFQVKASEPSQYRLSYSLTDDDGNSLEGGSLLTVTGAGFDGSEFRFNDIELIPDQRQYKAGDKVALQINTNRTGAAVLLFLRPSGGIYLAPQLVQLDGKSKIIEIDVRAQDTPNFFVEAVTVHGGNAHSTTRELFVPPVGRLLNVEVVPSADAYLPRQTAKIAVKLTDRQGEPFVGSLAKALDYIAGGNNVADIREFFWKWRRNHRPRGETNLERGSQALVSRNKPSMQNLGVFGATVVDEISGPISGGGSFGAGVTGMRTESRNRKSGMMRMAAESSLEEAGEFADAEFDAPQDGQAEVVQPEVRENFADTSLWVGSLETNAEGIAEVDLEMPENLTNWKIRVWGMGHGTRVGEGAAEVVTRKNIIIRLQAPRFFVERDEVVLSANVHNYLPTEKQVRVQLALEGETLVGPKMLEEVFTLSAGGEQRVDWRVKVVREGTATIRMSALTDEESDAMQMSFPVYVHGMLKTESFTGVIRPTETVGEFTFTVPTERQAEQSRLEIRYTPTLAGAMVDALPYLLDYPYGCTEQTLNRFLPAVITQQTLRQMGLDLAAIREKRTNLNAQEIGDDRLRAQGWQRFDHSPVFDDAEMTDIVKTGVNRITEMQLTDGGWGWFSGWGERSYPHTTAVVVHGLLITKQNEVATVPGVTERGVDWLENYQAEQLRLLDNWKKRQDDNTLDIRYKRFADNIDSLIYMVLSEAGRDNLPMRDYLYRDRTKLSVYSLATFGLALQKQGDVEKLEMVMRNIGQHVRQDEENQTAWLELSGGYWWYWYGSEIEAHAYYLKLLAATDSKSDIAPRLVKYLLNNRKHATYWNSTRDTALVIEAFADFLRSSSEDKTDVILEVWIDGQQRKQVAISGDNIFSFDNRLVLTGSELAAGNHTVELRKQGSSPIYFNGYLTNFTLEDNITAAGLELKVDRRYFLLTPIDKSTEVAGIAGQVIDQKVERYERTPLANLDLLTSGDVVEVELVVDSKNDYEYILLEDMKAAGFEPVEIGSGYNGNELGAYVELRDDRVSLFVARLARGRHSVSYRLRAEIPGKFSALPTRASAMYAPELKANSDEIKLRISDEPGASNSASGAL